MKVFVGHSQTNRPLVRRVVRALEQAGLEVWNEERESGLGSSKRNYRRAAA